MSLEQVRAQVREAGGAELLERLEHLDRRRAAEPPRDPDAPHAPDPGSAPDLDVAFAGGGLSLLLAPLLADLGLRVAVFDRARIGAAHREWNASGPELAPLWRSGLFTRDEVAALVVARYRDGVCRWHGGGSYPVRGVLDHAVDAGRLLAATRARAEDRGVAMHDRCAVVGATAGRGAIALRVHEAGGRPRELTARVLLDARGASSPGGGADLVCPTVGGVLEGLAQGGADDEIDPAVGDILATTEDVEDGAQHVWEAFPGRAGETTVYLFRYARAEEVGPGALLRLYARFFERRPRYKRGDARLLRPTFGYIPGWSRLTAPPAPSQPRVLLVGDAAARHSPLTFCGFGGMLRSLEPASRTIARWLDDPRADDELAPNVMADTPLHAGTGALARMMASPDPRPGRAGDLNALLDAAFATLHEEGDAAYGALLRDEASPAELVRFLHATAARRPRVYADVVRLLGPRAAGRWGLGVVRGLLSGASV